MKFQSNLGGNDLAKHWNRCLDLVENEEWIMILGDDDFLDDDVISEFCKFIIYSDHKNVSLKKEQ